LRTISTAINVDTCRMRFEHEAAPVRVHERMALTSVDLLSSIITAWPASLGGLDALAVDDRGRGAAVAPDPFAVDAGLGQLEAEGLARHLVGTTGLRVSFAIRALFSCEGLIISQLGHEAALRPKSSC
jgi:hypothetical protein